MLIHDSECDPVILKEFFFSRLNDSLQDSKRDEIDLTYFLESFIYEAYLFNQERVLHINLLLRGSDVRLRATTDWSKCFSSG